MLAPEQVKPFVSYEDRHVRQAAGQYFASFWSDDPDILPLLLDARARYGVEGGALERVDLDHLRVTPPALDHVVARLDATENELETRRLNEVIGGAPLNVLEEWGGDLRDRPNVSPETLDRIERRRALAARPPEELWAELQALASRWDTEEEAESDWREQRSGNGLVDALAPHDVPNAATLCEMLRTIETDVGWLEIFLVELIGRRRIAAAVPALVERIGSEGDYLAEETSEALARIGDPDTSRLIRSAYPTSTDGFRLFAAGVLGAVKHPESEEAILAVLEAERDETFRTSLCGALCELFSGRGVEVVRHEILSGYDRQYDRLENRLLPVAEALGVALPEAERWRREREREEKRFAKQMAEFQETERRFAAMRAQGVDPLSLRDPTPAVLPSEPVYADVVAPIRRTTPKVGRNDPCPCGSGKKFKKCCGANPASE